MDDFLFNQLVDSLKEAKKIKQGKVLPSRKFITAGRNAKLRSKLHYPHIKRTVYYDHVYHK